MKVFIKLLTLFFGVLALANIACAESPQEQLKQMVEQLQKNPSDDSLRQKIISQAQTLRPAPSVPDEAERRMVRGAVAFKSAKSLGDFQEAAKEFEQATLVAPWYGDAYFNLGLAQDKAEDYQASLRSLKYAQLASPENKEIKTLIYEVEYRNEKAHSPEVVAARHVQSEQEKDAALLKSLDGAVFVWRNDYGRNMTGDVQDISFRINGDQITMYYEYISVGSVARRDGNYVGQIEQHATSRITLTNRRFKYATSAQNMVIEYEIAPDGRSITVPSMPGYSTFIRR